MPNILLISSSRSRTKYFNEIAKNLNLNVMVIANPISFNIGEVLNIKKRFNFEAVFEEKFREIEMKYPNRLYKNIYKKYIKFITPFIANAYEKEMRKQPLDIVGLWNGKKFPELIALSVAKALDIKCFYFENGLFPNTTVLDLKGVNASNSVPRNIKFYQNITPTFTAPKKLNQRKELGKRIKSQEELPLKYIFVPFQTNFDTQVIYHGRWIKNMEQLFNLINKLSKELKINFVLKEHPSEREMNYAPLHQQAQENPYIQFANSYATQTLIENAQAIVTINSSVGLESLLFNKKVIILGEAFYDIEGITKSAPSQERLTQILTQIEKWKIEEENIKKFLHYLIEDYLIKGDWKTPNEVHFKSLEEHICSFIEK